MHAKIPFLMILLLAGCTAVPDIAPTTAATRTPQPPPTAIPTAVPSSTPLPPPSPTATAVPTATPQILTTVPIFTGGDVWLQDWSPDDRYLAYFEYTEEQIAQSPVPGLRGTVPGTFTIYDTITGEKCQRYPLDATFPHEGPSHGRRHFWLPDGRLLVLLPDGRVIRVDAPCGAETELTPRFPGGVRNIVNLSPDETHLLLTGGMAYWLYNLQNQEVYAISEIIPDPFHNLVWSPDSAHIGVTLAGNYTGDRAPIGGTRVVDAATGQIVARYDWEPANALDGTFGGPVWLNENEMVITLSLDQGPFFMTVAGEVRPLLPLFGLEFERDRMMLRADVYVQPESGNYHILLVDMGWSSEQIGARLYHADTGAIEIPDIFSQSSVSLLTDGRLIIDLGNSSYLTRHITAVNEPFTSLPTCESPWQLGDVPYALHIPQDRRTIDIYTLPDCALHTRLQLADYADGSHHLQAHISPNGQWLVVIPTDPYGFGQALFLIPFPQPSAPLSAGINSPIAAFLPQG